MSRKVIGEIKAGIEKAVAGAKAAKRRGTAKRLALRHAGSYSRAEVLARILQYCANGPDPTKPSI